SAVGVRIEELRVLGADDDVGFIEEVHRAACGHAVHRGDHRLPYALLLGSELGARVLLAPDVHLCPPRPFPDVHAGAERPVTGGPQDYRTDLVILTDPPPELPHLLGHTFVERVEAFGTVQGHCGDMAVQFDLDRGPARLDHVVVPPLWDPGLSKSGTRSSATNTTAAPPSERMQQ